MTNTELIHIMLLWLLGIVIDILFIYNILKDLLIYAIYYETNG